MSDSRIAVALSELDPSEFEAAWRYLALFEQLSEIFRVKAEAWRVGVYETLYASGGLGAITDAADLIH